MSLEFNLSVLLKERTLELIPGQPKYVCIVEVNSDGKKIQHSFADGLNALKFVEGLCREWTNVIVGMKRDTITERKALEKRLGKIITP